MATEIKTKIVIVGYGWVGQANALALTRMGYEVVFYDVVVPKFHYADKYYELYEKIKSLKTLKEIDADTTTYIVCVGDRVAENGIQDITFIEQALEQLKGLKGKVVLRSTIIPTSLHKLSFDYYVPEFLHEIRAVEECLNPYYFVVGSRMVEQDRMPDFFKEWQNRACRVFFGTPEQAAYIKYLSNIWNAVRIAFVNEFGDSMMDPVSPKEREQIEQVIDFVLEKKSYVRYGQGFGGHCLPKDMRAFRHMAEAAGRSVPLLKGAYESNELHIKVSEKYKTLPQIFSTWDYSNAPRHISVQAVKAWHWFNQLSGVRQLRASLRPLRRFVERNFITDRSLIDIKERWNNFALHQPYYYVNPDTRSGRKADEFELKETGQADYKTLVSEDKLLSELGQHSDKKIAHIGPGVGRLTEHFSRDFAEVYAVDISPVMISIGQKRLSQHANISWLETNGQNLPLPDESVDLVFSNQVFKFLPSAVLVSGYLKEIERVLKPGGIAKIQLRTGPEIYKWRWFYGVSLSEAGARDLAERAGLQVVQTQVESAKDLWLWLRKEE